MYGMLKSMPNLATILHLKDWRKCLVSRIWKSLLRAFKTYPQSECIEKYQSELGLKYDRECED